VEHSALHADTTGRIELPAGIYTFNAPLKKPTPGNGGAHD